MPEPFRLLEALIVVSPARTGLAPTILGRSELALATNRERTGVDPIPQAVILRAIVIVLSIQALPPVVRDDGMVGVEP